MGVAFAYRQELVTISCGGCGVEFAVPAELHRRYEQEGASIRCPNPACPWPSMHRVESENAKLKKELASATEARRWAETNLASEREAHEKTRRKAKRIEKRIAAGVCPCCNRTFQNLARHMKTKHPESPV